MRPEFYSYTSAINEKYKKTFYKRLIIDMKSHYLSWTFKRLTKA